MSDIISGFKGIAPSPAGKGTWQQALENIKSEKYRKAIADVRELVKKHGAGSEIYKKQKCLLPGVTFGGTFSHRANTKILVPTGFIIPDIDSIPQQVENLFNLLTQDTNVWFVFRSPSGEGLKVGIRTQNIANDTDHKKFYFAIEQYFKELYGVEIDTACKDISRLTFVSYDPKSWINPKAQYFDVQKWSLALPPIPEQSVWVSDGKAIGKEKYAKKVLESCCQELLTCAKGDKHITRLKKSRLIGGYSQWLSEGDILSAFEQAITASGTPNVSQAMKTVKDGILYGKASPIEIEDNNRYEDQRKIGAPDDIVCDTCDTCDNLRQPATTCDRDATTCDSSSGYSSGARAKKDQKKELDQKKESLKTDQPPLTVGEKNLSDDIHAFLSIATGLFTTEHLDKELGITSRLQKQRRSYILRKYLKKEYKNKTEIILKKDPRKNNIYRIVKTDIEWVDLEANIPDNFPLKLPFDLDLKVSVPPKSIIVIAGSTNSGKTGIILEILRLNLSSSFEKLLLVSEGIGEIRSRIKSFGDSLAEWKEKVMVASLSADFEDAVENYNPNGLTCVDYMEPVEGEYFRLTNQIKMIYDSLSTGVAIIALQKHPNKAEGVGGYGTKEKARLYMTVDYLCTGKRSIVCALALTKVKQSLDESMQGKELHFRIERGSILTPLTDWMLSSRVNREKCARQYENEDVEKSFKKVEEGDYIFRTENGKNEIKMVRITRKQAEEWAGNMPNINVFKRLETMAADSMKKLFLNKGYLWQIVGTLDKAQKKAAPQTTGESG